MSGKAILKAKNLLKKFGDLIAVNDVSMEIEKGAFAILFGPNGAGKTTLINLITGYLEKDQGKVWFDGKDITRFSAVETFRLGLARSFQIPKIFPRLTVLENILMAIRNPGESFVKAPLRFSWKEIEKENVERAFEVLEMVGLEDQWDKLGGELSGGDIKLLEVGRALMSNAKMLLMDEPIAGVNPAFSHVILERLRKIREARNLTILIIEHRLDIALKYVDYAYAMVNGRIIFEGKPGDVIKSPEVIESYLGEKYHLG
ncbi:MAG: ABC transporter ATP-binding protein [Candidatus Bathyarchaeia archaeon]